MEFWRVHERSSNFLDRHLLHKRVCYKKALTTLQSVMNTKLSKHGFWHCHENGLNKTIQTIPDNIQVSVK